LTVSAPSGAKRIAEAFGASDRRAALMPYLMGGFPDLAASRAIGEACIDAGADVLELGVPFSDPLADGPIIHTAGTRALAAGATLPGVLDVGAELARRAPVVLMCYANLILAQGPRRFAGALAERGLAGLIVPDLPFEESEEVRAACDEVGVALVPLFAPTTPDARLAQIGAHARGFLYAVSVVGTTGERREVSATLADLLARARSHTSLPVAVGFGIGTPEQALAAAGAGADGVIVGTRLVRAALEAVDSGVPRHAAAAVGALVAEFAGALAR
jgi:tryptophan synthase alpha chain